MELSELKNKHKGADIWVIASGPSLNYVAPRFFDNKIVIGVNEVYRYFHVDYIVRKEYEGMAAAREWADAHGVLLIGSLHNCGKTAFRVNDAPHITFDHLDNDLEEIDTSIIGTDRLVVSYSTITSAIHLAAYMGAANIILAGHDCGTIDGQTNLTGYRGKQNLAVFDDSGYRHWLTLIEPQTLKLREALRAAYGCEIASLNPFVNLGMEGHKYAR